MSIQDFHKGHVKAVGVCPLCGEIITRTYSMEMETGNELVYGLGGGNGRRVVGVTQGSAPTIRIKWRCAGGCEIDVKGEYRQSCVDFFDTQDVRIDTSDEPKNEPLTGENLRELSPKAEQAKHALEELEEGMDSHGTKGESRSDAEPGRRSSPE